MKKYITLAALLAAGTALVNAAQQTIQLSDTEYTDGVVATMQLTPEQLKAIISTASVNTSLIGVGVLLDDGNTHSGTMGVHTWDDRNEFHVWYNKDAGVNLTNVGTSTSFSAPEGYEWPTGHAINKAFDLEKAVDVALTFAFAPKNAATDVYGLSVVLTVEYSDGTWKSIVGNASAYSWSNNSYKPTSVFYDDSLLTTPTVTVDGTWTHASLVATNEKVLGIPEPSAFGLLAGIGALALVASRRRRR